jgi:hypothetical protein
MDETGLDGYTGNYIYLLSQTDIFKKETIKLYISWMYIHNKGAVNL